MSAEKFEGNERAMGEETKESDGEAASASSRSSDEEGGSRKRKAQQDDEMLDNRLDFQKHKCEDLRAQLKLLDAGTCPEFLEQCKAVDSKLEEELAVIALLRKRHVDATSSLYDFDVAAAQKINRNAKSEIKDELRSSILDQIREIDDTMKLEASTRRISQRKLRSKTKCEEDPDAAGEGGEKYADPATCVEIFKRNFALAEEEVDADLKMIVDSWHETAVEFRRAQDFISVTVEGGLLMYDDLSVEKGHFILVQSEADQTQARGVVTAIRRKEIHLKSQSGGKWKIQVEHLRTGRVKIFPGDTPTE